MFDFVRNHTRLALGFMLLLIIPSFVFFGSLDLDGRASARVAADAGRTLRRGEGAKEIGRAHV